MNEKVKSSINCLKCINDTKISDKSKDTKQCNKGIRQYYFIVLENLQVRPYYNCSEFEKSEPVNCLKCTHIPDVGRGKTFRDADVKCFLGFQQREIKEPPNSVGSVWVILTPDTPCGHFDLKEKYKQPSEPTSQSNPLQIEIYEHKNGDWAYRFKRSGRILCWSEGYSSKSNCKRAFDDFIDGVTSIVLSSSVRIDYIIEYIPYNK